MLRSGCVFVIGLISRDGEGVRLGLSHLRLGDAVCRVTSHQLHRHDLAFWGRLSGFIIIYKSYSMQAGHPKHFAMHVIYVVICDIHVHILLVLCTVYYHYKPAKI